MAGAGGLFYHAADGSLWSSGDGAAQGGARGAAAAAEERAPLHERSAVAESAGAAAVTDARAELAELVRGLEAAVRRRAALAGELRVALPRAPAPPRPAGSEEGGSGAARAPSKAARPKPSPPAETAPPSVFEAREVSAEALANRALAGGCADLPALAAAVAACRACGLCETRTQTVFSDGTGRARVMFIGEAPGQHEDEQGVPFVGRAGQLLSDIITKGMGLRREDVYIANVLKCRPPENRDPEPGEKERCTPFLDRQIELVDPQVLITLGLHASQHVLGTKDSMGRLRGRVHQRGGRKVVATYHPAFLLRSPHMKKDCWADIQLAMRELGLGPSPGGRNR